MYICQLIITSCFIEQSEVNEMTDAFLKLNSDDSGLISRDQLEAVFGDQAESVFDSCSISCPYGISWTDFKVACSPAVNSLDTMFSHLEPSEEQLAEHRILEIFLQKVFGYLNILNKSKSYITPIQMEMVLRAQSFRFPHLDLKTVITNSFLTPDEPNQLEDLYEKQKIDF